MATISLSPQRFELVYGDGVLALTKVKDRAPLDASIRIDFNGGESSIALMLDGFVPSKSLRLSGRYASSSTWLELPYKGSLVLKAPGLDPARIGYEAKLLGYLPSSFLHGDRSNARAEIDAHGDLESMKMRGLMSSSAATASTTRVLFASPIFRQTETWR